MDSYKILLGLFLGGGINMKNKRITSSYNLWILKDKLSAY